jgi:hypothetical protein
MRLWFYLIILSRHSHEEREKLWDSSVKAGSPLLNGIRVAYEYSLGGGSNPIMCLHSWSNSSRELSIDDVSSDAAFVEKFNAKMESFVQEGVLVESEKLRKELSCVLCTMCMKWTHRAGHVCLSAWFNSKASGRIWMKLGTDVMPLVSTLKSYFSIFYNR